MYTTKNAKTNVAFALTMVLLLSILISGLGFAKPAQAATKVNMTGKWAMSHTKIGTLDIKQDGLTITGTYNYIDYSGAVPVTVTGNIQGSFTGSSTAKGTFSESNGNKGSFTFFQITDKSFMGSYTTKDCSYSWDGTKIK